MESEHVKVDVEHTKKNPDVKYEDGNKISPQAKNPDFSSASSISSSSSSSSSSGFDITEKGPFDNSSSAKSKFDENLISSLESISSPVTTTPDSSIHNSTSSQMKSPQIQTMGYDPNRIPASIFSTKATNPSEWSVASNESLFSIHMGNNSFSRDMFGKSGELLRLDEWNNAQSSTTLPTSLPPVIEVPAHEESCVASDKVCGHEEVEESKVVPGENVENHVKKKNGSSAEVVHHLPPIATKASLDSKGALPVETNLTSSCTPRTSTSNARLSDESGNSSSSFAFPVLVSDAGKTGSLSGVPEKPEKPQLQSQVSKATPKPSMTRWFSWFSCWPRCC